MCFEPFFTAGTVIAATEGGGVLATAGAVNWTSALMAASLVTQGGGLLTQITANRAAAEAAERRGAFEAGVARNDAILAERLAADAIKRGDIAAEEQERKTKLLIGAQRAGFASHGVLVDEGSAGDVTEDTAAFGKLDELTIKHNAEREALGFRTQGANFQSSGELAQLRAFQPDTTFGTALTGISSIAGRFVDWNTLQRRRQLS